ncbi:hypothetical protein B0H13DRAFT_1976871, partial [Mycena leptocephala]
MNNFLDPYDLTSGTPPQQSQQSLNEEVSQVMGQLGRFWGDFRKQSQTALETARKDIGGVVTQAQQEFTKLTAETPKSPADSAETTPTESGEESATPRTASPSAQDTPSSSGVQTLFTRLQSALPPNIVSTVQSHIPETLRDASGNIDLAQMRTTLTAEFQRVQGVTLAQAEEYVHKSEALLKEAMKEAGEVFRDAVKVVPPEEAQSSGGSGNLIWDGADMWMLPFDSSDASAKGKEKAGRQSTADTQLAVATRAESLLKRLKHDPEIIKHDPEADAATKEFYGQWLETAMKDGIESEEWTAKIATVLNESADGQGLKANQDALVPAEMTERLSGSGTSSVSTKSNKKKKNARLYCNAQLRVRKTSVGKMKTNQHPLLRFRSLHLSRCPLLSHKFCLPLRPKPQPLPPRVPERVARRVMMSCLQTMRPQLERVRRQVNRTMVVTVIGN